MKLFDDSKHKLNDEVMDNLHHEFLYIYNSADLGSNESIKQKLQQLHTHTINHFEIEEAIMNAITYTTKKEHIDEHTKVLNEMQYFINMQPTLFGHKMIKSYYIEKLPEWFDLHLLSMDSDLASQVKKFFQESK